MALPEENSKIFASNKSETHIQLPIFSLCIIVGVNDSADALLVAISKSEPEIAPSTVFAVASILEGCSYINGSPQNTFVPGVLQLAERHGVFIGGG
jgi:myo-inositol-1-phosphate synthase